MLIKPPDVCEGKLTIELVPATCWYSNVRSEVSGRKWSEIRKRQYRIARHRCEVCDGTGPRHPVECHEVWEFDDEEKIQKLLRMVALCPACHEVKHIGLAEVKGRYAQALQHLMTVNGWAEAEAEAYADWSFAVWEERSDHEWVLDISHLESLS